MYVEFLFAFMPVFLLFLGICQVALLASARLVVAHAALASVRAAVVVLEDSPSHYGDAPRGVLSRGLPNPNAGLEGLLSALEIAKAPSGLDLGSMLGGATAAASSQGAPQQGARMLPIRTAAEMPLLVLAPNERAVTRVNGGNLAQSLAADFKRRLPFSLEFTRAAAVITLHTLADGSALPAEPIPPRAAITVRVTYLFHCSVPLVGALMCRSLSSYLDGDPRALFGLPPGTPSALSARLRFAESPGRLEGLVSPDTRFTVMEAEATLPNQGAAYDHGEGS